MTQTGSRKKPVARTTRLSRRKPRDKGGATPVESLRERLAARLPDMLKAALAAYDAIALPMQEPEDARSLGAQQTAAKSALKHVEMILKLAEALLPPEAQDNRKAALLEAARAALGDSPHSGQAATAAEPSDSAA